MCQNANSTPVHIVQVTFASSSYQFCFLHPFLPQTWTLVVLVGIWWGTPGGLKEDLKSLNKIIQDS